MSTKTKQEAQNPLILRCHRLMEAFAKADDERDFIIDRMEGYIIYVDLDKTQEELDILYDEFENNPDRYCQIPKLTFYETKKIMEGFVNEKVYDIDTKEKLLDIIQSKEARENFLEFVYDHHSEFEKWQQYYQERSRIRIIEWLRNNNFHFVFEEDLDIARNIVEKLKLNLFETKVGKDILTARKALLAKAKTYYSSEALNPRPKRGRPPKQAVKQEIEPQLTGDIYISIPTAVRPFLFAPDHHAGSSAFTFSSKFESEEALLASRRQNQTERSISIEDFQNKLASLRSLSTNWEKPNDEPSTKPSKSTLNNKKHTLEFEEDYSIDDMDEEDDFEEEEEEEFIEKPKKAAKKPAPPAKAASKPAPAAKKPPAKAPPAKAPPKKKAAPAPSKAAKSKTPPPPPPSKGRPKGSTKKKRIIRK